MRKFSLIFALSFPFWGLFHPQGQANEAMLPAIQETVDSLQQSVRTLQQTVEAQNEVIQKQALRIDALEKRESGGVRNTAAARLAIADKIQGISQAINPDIGVVGTVQAHLTENSGDGEGRDTIALKELELNISQYVDPYSRLDAIVAFNDNLEAQNADIEEAYYSHWGLPLGFQGQIGKFRSEIGKQNLLHTHQLDTVDYPAVIRDFFGDEGLASSGARIQNLIPNPWDVPLELTGEVLRGNNGNSFSGISRRPIFNTHAKTFFEFTKESNAEFGWTTLFGDENPSMLDPGQDRYGVKVYGTDTTFNFLMREGRSLKFQNEIYFQNRGAVRHVNSNPWGFYSLADYRFSQKFSAGIRFDYVEPLDVAEEHIRTTSVSPYLTFWQSEFANFRLQYSHADPAGGAEKSDDAVYLQANFLIGVHKHPVQ